MKRTGRDVLAGLRYGDGERRVGRALVAWLSIE